MKELQNSVDTFESIDLKISKLEYLEFLSEREIYNIYKDSLNLDHEE